MVSVEFVVDLLILMFSVAFFIINLVIVLRTEKLLDLAFKLQLLASFVILLSAVLKIDKYLGIFSKNYADWIFYTSRLVSLLFFFAAGHVFLGITRRESYSKNKDNK